MQGARITFDSAPLAAALRQLRNVVERRNTIPILDNVRIDADGTSVRLTATNLDIWAQRTIAGQASEPWSLTVAAHRLADVVGAFEPGSQTVIEALDAGGVVVKSGRARIRFSTLPADQFPVMVQKEVVSTFALPAATLRQAFAKVRHTISTEETRYYLCGAFFHIDRAAKHLVVVSTDGFGLARLRLPLPAGAETMPDSIVRTACINTLAAPLEKHEGDVAIAIGDLMISVTIGDFTMIAKLVDGTYPDYTRVIPTDKSSPARFDLDSLSGALSRLNVAGDGKDRSIKIAFSKDIARISLNSAMHGEGMEEVPCEFGGADIDMGFNLRFLNNHLEALDTDGVDLGIINAAAPIIITSPAAQELTLMLMPMRV